MKQVPDDYYRRLEEADLTHWFLRGMEEISAALLRDRLRRRGLALMDAGCGTGGFLAFARDLGAFERLCGVDSSADAIDRARRRVPEADLLVGTLEALPFETGSFDLVALNDVLQHVPETEVEPSLGELHRVLKPEGALLVRTNGGRHARRERADWRLYDARGLAAELGRSGFRIERLTHVNMAVSVVRAARGLAPQPPTESTAGIPRRSGALATAIGSRLLALEASYLSRPGRSLPYGHTLMAVATPG